MSDFGDSAFSLLAWAPETLEGVPIVGGRHDLDFSGETMANAAKRLERENISRRTMKPVPLKSTYDVGGEYKVDAINPAQDWFPYTRFLGAAADPVTVETGAFQHRLSRLETDIEFDPTFTLYGWRNDGMGQRFPGARFNSLAVSWAEGQLLGATFGLVPRLGDYWADPVRTVGTGTVFPQIRGLHELAFNTSATAAKVHIKIISQTATTVTFKAKVGDAATYAGADQVATKGAVDGAGRPVWGWLRDHDNKRIGDRSLRVEYFFPTGTYVVNDEFMIANRRPEWTGLSFVDPTLAAQVVYSGILVKVNGNYEEIEVDSGSLTISRNVEAKYGVGVRGPRRSRSRGEQDVKIAISREYQDLIFREHLEMQTPFALKVEIFSGVKIGTTGDLYHSFTYIMPNVVATGKPATITGKDVSIEAIECTAHPSEDPTYPADVTLEIINDIPDLEAA